MSSSDDAKSLPKALVVGATGATGKHVVKLLLETKKYQVHVIVRSKERMMSLLPSTATDDELLSVTEASLLDLTTDRLKEIASSCQAIVCCLGHNMTFSGMFGSPRQLVTMAVQRLTAAMPEGCKFILMGSDGVAHPNDTLRPLSERTIIFVLRYLVPPHSDNEQAAEYLNTTIGPSKEWVIVRPTDLVDDPNDFKYTITDKPQGSLFGGSVASRCNVAHFMFELITNDSTWTTYKHKNPCIENKAAADEKDAPATTPKE